MVHYWDLEKCVIGTSQRLSFLPSSLFECLTRKANKFMACYKFCVSEDSVWFVTPKTELLVDFLCPVQRGMEDVPRREVWPICCGVTGEGGTSLLLWALQIFRAALVPGGSYSSYLFLVNALLDAGKESKSLGEWRLSETWIHHPLQIIILKDISCMLTWKKFMYISMKEAHYRFVI